MAALAPAEIEERLRSLPGWNVDRGSLSRQFHFSGFADAIAFVNQVAAQAESAGHHPDIDIRYNRVLIALVTHDAGGITAKDFELAATLSKLG